MKGKKAPAKCECVKVAVRVRPMNSHEKEFNSTVCVDVDTTNSTVSVTGGKGDTKTFQFDYVYPMDSTQKEVYDQVAFPIVDSVFQGYNGTIFAYGQTGCGKTFTMMGIVKDPQLRGVIPNAFNHIFGYIKSEAGINKKFLVRCSFVEIYNEEVRDLLGDCNKKLDVRDDPKKGTFIKELTYITLKDTNDIERCLDKGNKNRHVGHTSMNDQSSRSHSLFTVYVEMEEGEDERTKKIKHGKLNLVDLAGSERVGKTNATGQTFDEGKKINLSLTALGSVIDALSQNRKHIPYKDSKLTRLLSDSLGGNTKTVMFANVSPASYNYDETLGTLRYACRAKLIKNAPKINEDPKDALIRQYEEEIKALKNQLSGCVPPSLPGAIAGGDPVSPAGDDTEKEELLAKIAELERNLNNKNELRGSADFSAALQIKEGEDNPANAMNNEEIQKLKEKEEEERQKFKEYREQQLKANEQMEEKLKRLEEEKKKQEEDAKNDVTALNKKLKELNDELEDLRLEKDNVGKDFMDDIKTANKDAKLYREIIRFLLTDNELRRVIDMSRYIEEDEKWIIHPFCIKDKKLTLPNVRPNQIPVFIEGNIGMRDMFINGEKVGVLQGFKNYGNATNLSNKNLKLGNCASGDSEDFDMGNKRDNLTKLKLGPKTKLKLKDSNKNIFANNNENNNNGLSGLGNLDHDADPNELTYKLNKRKSKEKITITSRQAKSQNPMNRNIGLGIQGNKQTTFNNVYNINNVNNINSLTNISNNDASSSNNGYSNGMTKFLLNKKEREKFEELGNVTANLNLKNGTTTPKTNGLYLSSTNFQTHQALNSNSKPHVGKVFLNPLNSKPDNKLEVSFKATLEIGNPMANTGAVAYPELGRIKLSKIQEKENDGNFNEYDEEN